MSDTLEMTMPGGNPGTVDETNAVANHEGSDNPDMIIIADNKAVDQGENPKKPNKKALPKGVIGFGGSWAYNPPEDGVNVRPFNKPGLYHWKRASSEEQHEDDGHWSFFCSPVRLCGNFVDKGKQAWAFAVYNTVRHFWTDVTVPNSQIGRQGGIDLLTDYGLAFGDIAPDKNAQVSFWKMLRDYGRHAVSTPDISLNLARQTGWYGEDDDHELYILADGRMITANNAANAAVHWRFETPDPKFTERKLGQKGTIEGYREAIRLIKGNTTPTVCWSFALAVPMLETTDSVAALCIYGPSGDGKTVCARVGASVYGDASRHTPLIFKANATKKGLNAIASAMRHHFWILDEATTVQSGDVLSDFAYMIAGGTTAAGATIKAGQVRETVTIETGVIVTAEVAFEQILADLRMNAKAGQSRRVISVPIFRLENLHGRTSHDALIKEIAEGISKNNGWAIDIVIKRYAKILRDNPDYIRQAMDDEQVYWKQRYPDAKGQVAAVLESIIQICAINSAVLTLIDGESWNGALVLDDIREAWVKSFDAWKAEYGADGQKETSLVKTSLIEMLDTYREQGCIVEMGKGGQVGVKTTTLYGYYRDVDGGTEYRILPKVFNDSRIFNFGYVFARQALDIAEREGLFIPGKRKGKKMQYNVAVNRRIDVYCFVIPDSNDE